jgi:hypothetical protein
MLLSQYKLAMIRHTEFLRTQITGILNIPNQNSNFLTLQTSEFQKKNPTGIFGIENGIGILLPMGVPEIGTKNLNSQPSMTGPFKETAKATKEFEPWYSSSKNTICAYTLLHDTYLFHSSRISRMIAEDIWKSQPEFQ